jgi:PadR family transcriptional regulator PadR
MTDRKTNPAFLNGVPELLILRLLAARAMHGYEIVQTIRARTGARLDFGEGCIYPILHRLEAEGLLKGQRQMVAGRSRVVYRVTADGRRRLVRIVENWRLIAAAIEGCLKGGGDVRPELA